MTNVERWFLYAVAIGVMVLTERRIIDRVLLRAEQRYWERRR